MVVLSPESIITRGVIFPVSSDRAIKEKIIWVRLFSAKSLNEYFSRILTMETDDEDEVVFWKLLPSVLE